MYDDVHAFLDDKDYPDAEDIEEFGYDSPPDYSPLTIGYIDDERPPFWTSKKIIILIVATIIIAAFVLPALLRLF